MTNYTIAIQHLFLRDGTYERRDLDIEAIVASGDCLVTLATSLDQYMHRCGQSIAEIDNIIQTLLYLQRHYKLERKTPDHRQ